MKTKYALMLAAIALTGCGAAVGHAPISPTVATLTQSRAQATHMSGIDNPFEAFVFTNGEPGMPVTLSITYDDRTHYFGGQADISAFARVTFRDRRPIEFKSIALRFQPGGANRHVGSVTLPTAPEEVVSADLAFFVDDKWDSDHGRNYTIGF